MSAGQPTQKRRFSRYEVNLDAQVRRRGAPAQAGKIRDFSAGGMYIAWSAPVTGMVIDEAIEVRFLCAASGRREFQIAGIVVRVMAGGVGIVFANLSPEILRSLQQEHQAHQGRKQVLGDDAARDALAKIRSLIEKPLAAAIEAFSEQAEQSLFDQARNATAAEQRELLDARGQLMAQRSRLPGEIVAAVFEDMTGARVTKTTSATQELSLIDGFDLEYMLAQAELGAKVEEQHKGVLSELQNHYSSLVGAHLDLGHLPAGPQAISSAFSEAMRKLGLSPREMRLVHKVFQEVLGKQFGEVYRDVNRLLVQVVPVAGPRVAARPGGTAMDLSQAPATPQMPFPGAMAGGAPPGGMVAPAHGPAQALVQYQMPHTGVAGYARPGFGTRMAPARPVLSPAAAPHTHAVWERAAHRLKVGDALMVSRDGGPPEPHSLAWIGEGAGSYVLVDSSGRRASTLSSADLAAQLYDGRIAMQRPAPVMQAEPQAYAQARAAHEEMRQRALHDAATGLGNRKKFLSDWRSSQQPGTSRQTVLYLRTVETEPLVARFGVEARDAFLRKLTGLVQQRLGEGLVMNRVADLEFVLLHSGDELEVRDAATRLQREVRHISVRCGGETFSVGARIGVLEIPNGADPEAVLQAASAAAGAAESAADSLQKLPVAEDVDWAARLQASLQTGLPPLFVRRIEPLGAGEALPMFEVATGLVQGERILIPGEDVDAALSPAQQFELDLMIIAAALDWMAKQAELLDRIEACCIRLRAGSVADGRLLEWVLELLMSSPVPPAKLCFDISEASLNASFELAQDLIRTLREYGCRFVLGGVERTETNHDGLNRVSFDGLRFGGHFVRDLAGSSSNDAVVKSAHEMGHLLGLKTIAADVGSAEVLARIREIGFDYAQGDAVAPAMPIAEVRWP